MNRTFPALVVAVGKNAAWVALDGEATPRVADLKRSSGARRMLLPGDRVEVRLLEDGRVLTERIEPRRFVLERRTVAGRAKAMAANVDTLVTVTSLAEPPPRLLILDQLLAFAELESVAPVVLLTKADLAPAGEADALRAIYDGIGYQTLVANPKTGAGIDELRALLRDRRSLLCGVSGVGKSSTFRALGGSGPVGEVSRRGIGRQTTTAARLFRLDDGFLIDSPGVAEFGLGAIGAPELAAGFRDFAPFLGRCRFTDCRHLHEPDCAVIAATERNAIAQTRYASYRHILDSAR